AVADGLDVGSIDEIRSGTIRLSCIDDILSLDEAAGSEQSNRFGAADPIAPPPQPTYQRQIDNVQSVVEILVAKLLGAAERPDAAFALYTDLKDSIQADLKLLADNRDCPRIAKLALISLQFNLELIAERVESWIEQGADISSEQKVAWRALAQTLRHAADS